MKYIVFSRALLGTGGLLCLLVLPMNQAQAQGFGLLGSKTVEVNQLLPATVNLNGKHIMVEATSAIKTSEELGQVLQTKLVTMIQKDPRFIIDGVNPETVLKFKVTNFYIDKNSYTIGTGAQTQNCIGYVGKLEVSYQAIESAHGVAIDSENLKAAIENDKAKPRKIFEMPKKGACGTDAKASLHDAQDQLIDEIVFDMGQRAAPTVVAITVKVPGRKLEPLSRLAIAQRWADLEEEAQKTEKLPKPEDDAYRSYLVGLAQEAQAYALAQLVADHDSGKRKDITDAQSQANFKRAMDLIDEARKNYKDAMQENPREKEFQEPDNRMEKAVEVYATIVRHQQEFEKAVKEAALKANQEASTRTKPAQPTKGVGDAPASGKTPLQQIVEYCDGKIGMETINEYIADPGFLADAKGSGYTFDIRKDPFTLSKHCGASASVIQATMKKRLNASAGAKK